MTGVLSQTRCTLGEGLLWHPERQSLFWFDILGQRLFEHDGARQRGWAFDRAVSAAGWIDADRLLVASARDLCVFDLATGTERHLADLEADQAATRSNDGRADPQGGFWIGTMGYGLEPGMGAIYRFYRGELRRLYPGITVPNAICFAPDGRHAFFTDTPTRVIRRVALDAEGWPAGEAEPWLDLNAAGVNPDGAVIDTEGRFWNAQWGAHRVACYGADGRFLHAVDFPAAQISCPCFGGPELRRLYATSAAENAGEDDPQAGQTFQADPGGVTGQAEHRVIL
jgi:sugar lactone lactonase YvrE